MAKTKQQDTKSKNTDADVKSTDDPLTGWTAQQGAPGEQEKSRLYQDDPRVYSEDELPRNYPGIVPEGQRGDLDAEATASDGGPQTANVDPKEAEEAEKADAKAREEEDNDEGDKKTVKKASKK